MPRNQDNHDPIIIFHRKMRLAKDEKEKDEIAREYHAHQERIRKSFPTDQSDRFCPQDYSSENEDLPCD